MDSDQTNMEDHPIVASLRKEWPPVFALSRIDKMSGGAIGLSTIRNMRTQREIPLECFARNGPKKVVVHRDLFLDWWNTQLGPCDE